MATWVLPFVVLCPMVAAVLCLLVPARHGLLYRAIAILGAALTLPPAIWLCMAYDRTAAGFQFAVNVPWVPTLGIALHLAADGVSVVLILLTAIIVTAGIAASWTQQHRAKEFLALLLLLVGGVFGVFASRDVFFLFLFYEVAVLPMYLLIGLWGSSTKERTKEHSAMKLTIMLLGGSALILVAILAVYLSLPVRSFDLDDWARAALDPATQRWVFLAIYFGFGVLAGAFPFHTWSPDGHASAPTAVSMLHAGVLMKLGAYGVLRLGVELLPGTAGEFAWLMGGIATINILYGALSALGQKDLKYVIAYSSVSHMGVVMLGLASLNSIGVTGSVMQMVSHGIMTGLFFAVVGLIYGKAHTRDTTQMGGFAQVMPGIAVCMVIGGLASFGLPATSGFIAEFLSMMGMWLSNPVLGLLSVAGIVVTAVYVLRVMQRIFFGKYPEGRYPDLSDARTSEWYAIVGLAILLIVMGVWPRPVVSLIEAGLRGNAGVKQVHSTVNGFGLASPAAGRQTQR